MEPDEATSDASDDENIPDEDADESLEDEDEPDFDGYAAELDAAAKIFGRGPGK